MAVGDTVFSPPTTDARLTIQFISLPTFHLEGRRILVFLIKLSSFLKQIFHIYHFLEEKHFYKKNLVVKTRYSFVYFFSCSFCFKFRKTTANHSNPDYNYRKYNSNHFFHCKPKTGNKNFYKKYFVSQLKHIISVNFIIQL